MAKNQFKRKGIHRVFAFLLGLSRFKAITFHDEHFAFELKNTSIPIKYTDVILIKHGGWPFKKFRINNFDNSYAFRGLTKKDLRRLLKQYGDAEALAWRLRLQQYERELSLVSSWITDVEQHNYYQRTSVFASGIKTARKIERGITGQIPESVSKDQLAKDLRKARSFLKNTNGKRESYNAAYIPLEIARNHKLFDEVESNPLTNEQRKAVVVDEDANLVIASAGSGKTSVIVAKAAWLVQKGLRQPNEILLLAFGKDAQKEMEERISEKLSAAVGSQLTVNTFHSLGIKIISEVTGARPSLSKLAENQNNELATFVRETIATRLKEGSFYNLMMKWFSEFFAPYESEFNFENQGQYWDYVRKNKIISLKGDAVKSFEECEVANFLYLNGVKYEYEADYKHDTRTETKAQYRPDFYLIDFDIYIEHLGLKGFGRTAPYVDRRSYIQSAIWKRKLHKRLGTNLIETYSCEKAQGILTERLREKLLQRGVNFQPLSSDEVFTVLNERKQIDEFTKLVITFLGHYKGAQLTESDLGNKINKLENTARHQAFINVFLPIYESYQEKLKSEDKIDFHDMISEATELVKSGKYSNPFGYVMVDEFQDISVGRSKLIKALQENNPDTQIFCVGDDWQAIYRFTGADINIMKQFEENFGASSRSDLSKTFRCEEKITEHAKHFVLQNDFQISKNVEAIRKSSSESVIICFRTDDETDQIRSITSLISDELIKNDISNKKSVLFLGRYRTEILSSFAKFDYYRFIRSLNQDYKNLDLSYKTMHGSKGLEADYVIILDHGFPSEKVDDPILNLVLAEPELYPNAEERRLFYVALTRAKEKVFIATQSGVRSSFIDEIIKNPINFNVLGKELPYEPKCPKCVEGRLVLREEYAFWGCNNYFRFECDHKEAACPFCKKGYPLRLSSHKITCSVCEQPIVSCPEKDCNGFLQQRTNRTSGENFWGCKNYFNKERPCSYTRKELRDDKPPKKKEKKTQIYRRASNSNLTASQNKNINHGKAWSKVERDKLRKLINEGLSDELIARSMGRSTKAIKMQRENIQSR